MQDATDNNTAPGTPPPEPQKPDASDPQTQPLTAPIKTRPFQWLKDMFGFGQHDLDEVDVLIERGRRKTTPLATPQSNLEELAIHAEMSVGDLVKFLSKTSGDDEEVINSFEEENEHAAGSAVHHIWITFFYLVPPIAAIAIGLAVGLQFSGGGWSLQTIAVIAMCIIFEAVPVLLMLTTAKLLGRAMSGVRSSIGGVIAIGLLFILVAIGSSLAQWVLIEGHVDIHDTVQLIGGAIRTFALPLAEIVAAITLPILRKKSLDSHLAIIQKKNNAKIAINRQRVTSQIDILNAAMQTKSSLQKEDDYQKKQDLANKLIKLVTDRIIKDAEKNLGDDQNQDTGNSSRRDSRR